MYRSPKPVANFSKDDPATVAEAIRHARRRGTGPHVPIRVFVRAGKVYVLRECYAVCVDWERKYPEALIGVYSGRLHMGNLTEDMRIARDEFLGEKGLDPVAAAFQAWHHIRPITLPRIRHGKAHHRETQPSPQIELRFT